MSAFGVKADVPVGINKLAVLHPSSICGSADISRTKAKTLKAGAFIITPVLAGLASCAAAPEQTNLWCGYAEARSETRLLVWERPVSRSNDENACILVYHRGNLVPDRGESMCFQSSLIVNACAEDSQGLCTDECDGRFIELDGAYIEVRS